MAKKAIWQDDYWLLLMEIYLREPIGVKPLYSRAMVDLSLELHIPPQALQTKMNTLSNLKKPRIERIWQTYANAPKRLARAVRLWREMKGFGRADKFYDGVEINETFERDWQPLAENSRLTPVKLILILNLYFYLTPITMVAETPEVMELAKLLRLKAAEVAEVLDVFQHCDPYLNRRDVSFNPLLLPCQQVWQRYGNSDTEALNSLANQLSDYFRDNKS